MKEKKAALVMGYWESADLQMLHFQSKRWLSEIDFWEDELQFMQNLMRKHFLYFFEKERLTVVNTLTNRLATTLKNELELLEKEVQLHEIRLASFIKSPRQNEEKTYRAEHARLDHKIKVFDDNFKLSKQELFHIAEEVLKEEKMKKIAAAAG